ncbi:MAG: LpxI family protein [Janthinobacterium lividum]
MDVESEELPALGIVAGGGSLPGNLAKIYSNLGGKCYLAAIDESSIDLTQGLFNKYESFKIGEVKKLISYFKNLNVTNIVFAGNIKRPNIASIKFDLYGAILIVKILKQKLAGDDKILRIVAEFFESKGFKILAAHEILALAQTSYQLATTTDPTHQDIVDTEIGLRVARSIGLLDIGQAVIVEDGYVLGIEAAEGTDQLIDRCAKLRKKCKGGVLIKIMKPNQDVRLDIPTIGERTIEKLAALGYNGVAIEASNVIIINPEGTFSLANKLQIFIKKI